MKPFDEMVCSLFLFKAVAVSLLKNNYSLATAVQTLGLPWVSHYLILLCFSSFVLTQVLFPYSFFQEIKPDFAQRENY